MDSARCWMNLKCKLRPHVLAASRRIAPHDHERGCDAPAPRDESSSLSFDPSVPTERVTEAASGTVDYLGRCERLFVDWERSFLTDSSATHCARVTCTGTYVGPLLQAAFTEGARTEDLDPSAWRLAPWFALPARSWPATASANVPPSARRASCTMNHPMTVEPQFFCPPCEGEIYQACDRLRTILPPRWTPATMSVARSAMVARRMRLTELSGHTPARTLVRRRKLPSQATVRRAHTRRAPTTQGTAPRHTPERLPTPTRTRPSVPIR